MARKKMTSPPATDYFAGLDSNLDDAEMKAPPSRHEDMRGQLATADDAKQFILAGKAIITLRSQKTGARFTYRISAAEEGDAFFVGLLSGPDNTANYQYIGRIARGVFWAGRKTPRPNDISKDAPSVKAFDWTWRALAKGVLPGQLEIWHEGACGRCGRRLTVPESVAQGFGPECVTKV